MCIVFIEEQLLVSDWCVIFCGKAGRDVECSEDEVNYLCYLLYCLIGRPAITCITINSKNHRGKKDNTNKNCYN